MLIRRINVAFADNLLITSPFVPFLNLPQRITLPLVLMLCSQWS
jgi:hypothetical protein